MSATSDPKIVIVGAGQAGAEVATSLRQQGHTGRIQLIGEEAQLPYRRPPLSKAYLTGDADSDSLLIKPRATYDKAQIELIVPAQVARIDREARRVVMTDGREEEYDKVVLATGGQPRRLPIQGAEAPNVLYLRTLNDVDAIRAELQPQRRMVVIGGGYIGLEVAASARKQDVKVTVLESAPRVLVRVTAPEMSAFYERVHREAGVDVRTDVSIDRLELNQGRVVAVILADGSRINADLVVVGIGLVPNVNLARNAGLDVGDGIIVDEFGRTSDPDILAIGDCAYQPNAWLGRPARIESVPNAMEQARTAATTLCGKTIAHRSVPWFWSDQYDLKLQMVGLSQGYDQVVMRGDPAGRTFCTFYLREGTIIAVDAVNRAAEFMISKRLVADRVQATAAVLADEAQPLQALLPLTLKN
ncbi:MAG: FAD-dependent oxidoreductase [Gallionella sp.]|nr:FAD-dependent oxidoreductase [Gallionella sp.]